MSNEKASSSQIRQEFVENARRFFKNPKIRSTPLDEQKKFLLSKGVSEAEIDSALDSIPEKDVTDLYKLQSFFSSRQIKRQFP